MSSSGESGDSDELEKVNHRIRNMVRLRRQEAIKNGCTGKQLAIASSLHFLDIFKC